MRRFFFVVSCTFVFAAALGCEEDDDPPIVGQQNNDEGECSDDSDCEEGFVCDRTDTCVRSACFDRIQGPTEVDVDCGGECGPCDIGSYCRNDGDCASNSCVESVCRDGGGNNGEEIVCEDPGADERFKLWDNGLSMDISYQGGTGGAEPVLAAGVGMVDVDLDGDVDVIVTNQGGAPGLFLNAGNGGFTKAAGTVFDSLTRTSSVSAADIDGDGDVDLVLGRTEGGVYTLVNQGDGQFVDETASRGIGEPDDVVSSGAFADFDGDGDLDFYLGSYLPPFEVQVPFMFPEPRPNRLYQNDGTGVFTPMAQSPGGVGEEGSTLAVAWWDFDEDGRPDLWSSNDFGMLQRPSQLWRNGGPDPNDPQGWLWEDISDSANVGVAVFGMTTSLADFDNDGDRDGYVGNMAQNVLHVVDGGTTTDEAVERGVACDVLVDPRPAPLADPEYVARLDGMQPFLDEYTDSESPYYSLTSWAATFMDFDHDGWQDLHVVNGSTLSDLTPEANFQPNYLFNNNGDGTFSKSECWTIPDIRGTSRGAAAGDIDGDGDMDVVWVDQGDNGDAGVYVMRNDLSDGNWLIVDLEGLAPNTEAVGAKVVLNAGGLVQTRWIDGGQSFMSVSERVAHFGIGAASSVDQLEVTWPDGTTQRIAVDAVNQRVVVQQLAVVE